MTNIADFNRILIIVRMHFKIVGEIVTLIPLPNAYKIENRWIESVIVFVSTSNKCSTRKLQAEKKLIALQSTLKMTAATTKKPLYSKWLKAKWNIIFHSHSHELKCELWTYYTRKCMKNIKHVWHSRKNIFHSLRA